MTSDDYVLGTHDEELSRLGLQHTVWRPRALDAWRRAGFTSGQTLLDIGCGPGYATTDLADITGRTGRVVAVDRSQRFLDRLRAVAAQGGLAQIETHQIDLDVDALPPVVADGAWARWVFAFLQHPRELAGRVADALRPGGLFVAHEYFHYATWRFLQKSEVFEDFVATVMSSWRASGGEPDIGRVLPAWLEESGLEIVSLQAIVDVIAPSNFVWQWPKTFVEVGLERLRSIGAMSAEGVAAVRSEFASLEATPGMRMVTPAVLEIIARKR